MQGNSVLEASQLEALRIETGRRVLAERPENATHSANHEERRPALEYVPQLH
jgi:hypothetical protein